MIAGLLRRLGTRVPVPVPESLPGEVTVIRNAWIPALGGRIAGMSGPASAVTIGDTILVHPDARATERLMYHELTHVRQWRERPLLFPLHYLWCHMRYGYRDNPYEVEARQAETTARSHK